MLFLVLFFNKTYSVSQMCTYLIIFCLFIYICMQSAIFKNLSRVHLKKRQIQCDSYEKHYGEIFVKKSYAQGIYKKLNIFFLNALFIPKTFVIVIVICIYNIYIFFQRPFTRMEEEGKIEAYDALSDTHSYIIFVLQFYDLFYR